MLKAIDRRLHNEYAIEASFHGIKLEMKGVEPVVEEEPFDEKIAEKALLEAQSRVRSRYV